MSYPDYFPKDCPPPNCETENRLLYRLCKGSEISSEDFKSYYLLGLTFNDNRGYGLSMIASLEEARKYLLLPKKILNDKKFKSIAKGYTENDGVWKYTASKKIKTHITWWLKNGVEPWKRFEIVED